MFENSTPNWITSNTVLKRGALFKIPVALCSGNLIMPKWFIFTFSNGTKEIFYLNLWTNWSVVFFHNPTHRLRLLQYKSPEGENRLFNDSETLRTEASLCTCIGSFIALQGLASAFPLASSTTDDIISIFQDILASLICSTVTLWKINVTPHQYALQLN